MDRFRAMTVYVAVAEEESFAAGARRLSMSPPAVTRIIAALERHLGAKLLTRTTRFVRATDAGRRYLEQARRILAEVDEADESAAGAHSQPQGLLVVTAPVLFGRMYVMPGILDFLRRFPAVSVSATLLDRVVNFLEEGIDVGVRIGELPDSTLHAIGVGHIRRIVCASPQYLKRHGTPRVPADLAKHTIVAANAVTPSTDWRFGAGRNAVSVKVRPRLMVSNNEAAIIAAAEGFGVTRLLSYQVAPYLESGALRTVLTEHEPARLPVHVVHSEGRLASAKVRTFVDLLVSRLRADKALR